VADAATPERIGGTGPTRLDVAIGLLTGDQQALVRKLAGTHALRFYRFSRDATALGATPPPDPAATGHAAGSPADPSAPKPIVLDPALVDAIKTLKPEGGATQVVASLLTVLGDLQGQRLAGVVLISDGRETPGAAGPASVDKVKGFGVKVVAVPIGSEAAPRNLTVTTLGVQDSAFKDDLVSAKVGVRATGYDPGKAVTVRLKDKRTGQPLLTVDGKPAEAVATFADDRPQEVEVVFQPKEVGTLDVVAEVAAEDGELTARDNLAQESVAVLDARVNVLYVDGYPRWEYRYIKNEMIRDKSVNISCLLTSADQSFYQEADRPDPDYGAGDPRTGSKFPGAVTRFPETAEELGKYDVVLFGDVDPRQFTDRQLQLLTTFVSAEAGGFGMIAGPQHAPAHYRNTALEAVLPVQIAGATAGELDEPIRDGWRPVVTDEGRRGEAATVFRFFPDKDRNDKYLRDDLQPLFWFSRGVTAKSGVGLVYAEHPTATDPTGRKAPLLVLGRFGAGRTLFSAIDDSWRWRYYTGESVFDTYWVQQIRYLARGRKLAERGIKFAADRERYERGQTVKLTLTVLSPKLLTELPPQLKVDVADEAGNLIRQETLLRQESPDNLYTASYPAVDGFGAYRVKLAALSDTVGAQERAYQVVVPRLELEKPEVDRAGLLRLTSAANIVAPVEAREKLPGLLPSAAKTIPLLRTIPLWDNPLTVGPWTTRRVPHALAVFMLLLTAEWVLRKAFGML
ncbi:MAG: von Willebrand factor type domain protein, partial [Phycisphaerales bacterium]|nr:von Willebrand factor type domain protein [Phycisphaerales bacterium]